MDTRQLYMSSYTVKAGDDVCLSLPVYGKPTPTVRWQNTEGTWRETQRCNTELIKKDGKLMTQLNVKECVRSDATEFIVTLKNSSGEKQQKVRFIVLDRPSPPVGPVEFNDTTTNSCTVD